MKELSSHPIVLSELIDRLNLEKINIRDGFTAYKLPDVNLFFFEYNPITNSSSMSGYLFVTDLKTIREVSYDAIFNIEKPVEFLTDLF